jgi:hypothetical protein
VIEKDTRDSFSKIGETGRILQRAAIGNGSDVDWSTGGDKQICNVCVHTNVQRGFSLGVQKVEIGFGSEEQRHNFEWFTIVRGRQSLDNAMQWCFAIHVASVDGGTVIQKLLNHFLATLASSNVQDGLISAVSLGQHLFNHASLFRSIFHQERSAIIRPVVNCEFEVRAKEFQFAFPWVRGRSDSNSTVDKGPHEIDLVQFQCALQQLLTLLNIILEFVVGRFADIGDAGHDPHFEKIFVFIIKARGDASSKRAHGLRKEGGGKACGLAFASYRMSSE